MNGQPCIRRMRLPVRRVVEAVALYPDRDDLFRNYPELEPEDVRQALHSIYSRARIIGRVGSPAAYLPVAPSRPGPNAVHVARVTSSRPDGMMVNVSAELDRLIHEKRSQLKDAFAAYRKSREAVAHAHRALAGIAPEGVTAEQVEIRRLESQERDAATRFHAISEELAHLHREKHGEWRITWRGPRTLR